MLLNVTSGLPDYLNNSADPVDDPPAASPRLDTRSGPDGLGTGLGPATFSGSGSVLDSDYIVLGGILDLIAHGTIERDSAA